MSNAPTTKQQHSASALRPSRLCQCLLLALALKVALIGGVAYEALLGTNGKTVHTAAFAADAAPAAPTSIQAPLPDAGMTSIPASGSTGLGTTPSGNTTSGNAGTGSTGSGSPRALPSIGNRAGIGASGTPEVDKNTAAQETLARDALTRRQEELTRKEEELKNLQQEISGKLEQMQILESRLQIMMKDAKGTTDAKLRHLVDVLANMKAKQAALVLETLDMRTAVKVLSNMRGKQAGEILTFVTPEKAAALAEALSRMQMPME